MSIVYKTGDLFESNAKGIVVTVNCVGVMGKGIALTCKQRYPSVFQEYKVLCDNGVFTPGMVHQHVVGDRLVFTAATKNHWRYRSEFMWIVSIIAQIKTYLLGNPTASIAIPPLGCGNGGLDWTTVDILIHEALRDLPNDIEVYAPIG